jgi:putative redox protein
MGEVHITWLQDLQFVGTDSTRHSIVISPPGDESVGMKPSELLLVALAGCTGIDVANILRKKRIDLNHLRISVTGEQDPTPPWAFRKMHIHYQASGKDLTSKAMEQAIRLSEEKYCSVAATLKPSVEITQDFELVQTPNP